MVNAVIVGGGLSGLFAARVLLKKGLSVTLVEQSEKLGGLMRSDVGPGGRFYDKGTHFVLDTGVNAVDEILLEGMDISDWICIEDNLKEGSFFNGVLNTESGCPDIRTASPTIRTAAAYELISNLGKSCSEPSSLKEYLLNTFGPCLLENFFTPNIRKLLGCAPETLAPDAHRALGLSRVILFDSIPAKVLKSLDALSEVLAYGHRNDHQSSIRKFYPKMGGVGRWIVNCEEMLRRGNANIAAGCTVASIEFGDGRISSVRLSDGQRIECDHLVWSTAPIGLLKLMGLSTSNSTRPEFRDLALHHIVMDQPPSTDLHYSYCFDPSMQSYRTTFYTSICPPGVFEGGHHFTVEQITAHDEPVLNSNSIAVFQEHKDMGLIRPDAKIIDSELEMWPRALPVATPQLGTVLRKQTNLVKASATNVSMIGRASDGSHFQQGILTSTFDALAHI